MKQIKTILERKPEDFDNRVNACLRDGWKLKYSKISSDLIGALFLARMEKEPGTCDDCRFRDRLPTADPCNECGADYKKWEAAENEEEENHE